MAFTDNCDLFASVHENGVNRVIQHIMRQRPSLFNYATADVAGNRELWCQVPEFTADVTTFGNPIFTVLPYLPVIGADSPPVGIGFCVKPCAPRWISTRATSSSCPLNSARSCRSSTSRWS